MPSLHVLTVLEDWRSEFESDGIIKVRDRRGRGRKDRRFVKKTFLDLAYDLDLQPVAYGSCRMTFVLDKGHVLKVGFSRFGMRANLRESWASSVLPTAIHAVVYAVAPDGLWLVQERVRRFRLDFRTRRARKLAQAIKQSTGQAKIDPHKGNFGLREDGTVVMLDLEFLGSLQPTEDQTIKRHLFD